MRWQGGRRSSNVEDRRGSGLGRPLALGAARPPSSWRCDTLQRRAQGYVVPESFTHGSSEQRVTFPARAGAGHARSL
ncbi:neutral zinc metallopeptidase [Myxococcus xanthus]|uniref:neutral zinc metallopeptidase n=1 Tax=Myxococcus xanthus TaxID=34 RepID=UPI001CED725C|nr:neutral zinc metallopeptidase [Myxococcus xanthus]